MIRNRQLHENTVNARIGIELADQAEQMLLRCLRRQLVGEGDNPHLFAGQLLVFNIDMRCRIVADQNHRQSGRAPVFCGHGCHVVVHVGTHAFGERFAVEYFCG